MLTLGVFKDGDVQGKNNLVQRRGLIDRSQSRTVEIYSSVVILKSVVVGQLTYCTLGQWPVGQVKHLGLLL